MRIGDMHKYLEERGVGEPWALSHEEQVRAFLERMDPKLEPENVNGDSEFYSKLVGASTIISHLLPKTRGPGKLLDSLVTAYSARGECIFQKEPVSTSFRKLVTEADDAGELDLEKLSSHKNKHVRKAIVTAVSGRTLGRHAEEIVNLLGSGDETLRESAAIAIGGDKRLCSDHSAKLVGLFKDPSLRVRQAAVDALGNHPQLIKRHANEISNMFSDPSEIVKDAAVSAIGSVPNLAKKYGDELERMTHDKDHCVKTSAIIALGSHPQVARKHANRILHFIDDNGVSIRHAAITAISKNPEILLSKKEKLDAMLKDPDRRKLRGVKAMHAIGAHPSIAKAYSDAVYKAIRDPFWGYRLSALKLYKKYPTLHKNDPEGVKKCLDHPVKGIRDAAGEISGMVPKHPADLLAKNPVEVNQMLDEGGGRIRAMNLQNISRLVRGLGNKDGRSPTRKESQRAFRRMRKELLKYGARGK